MTKTLAPPLSSTPAMKRETKDELISTIEYSPRGSGGLVSRLTTRSCGAWVPHIVERAPDFSDEEPNGTIVELLDLYLFINRELRRRNSETIGLLATETTPTILWDGPFQQLANSQVESGFADHRTYFHSGTEIDQQVHLGFDPRLDGQRSDSRSQPWHGHLR